MTNKEGSYRYLENLRKDYKTKLQSEFWGAFHCFIREELNKTEYKLHQLKEQELCLRFQLVGTSMSTFLTMN